MNKLVDIYKIGFIKKYSALILVSLQVVLILVIYITANMSTISVIDKNGRYIPAIVLKKSIYSNSQVINLAKKGAIQINSFNFREYETSIPAAREHFTLDAWRSYVKGLQDNGTIARLTSQLMLIEAFHDEEQGQPVIRSQPSYSSSGKRVWGVMFPMKIVYRTGAEEKVSSYVAKVTVSEVDFDENPKGIAITDLQVM